MGCLAQTVRAGIPVIVSAGDDYEEAFEHSPASAEMALTVAATDRNDVFARFNNYGPEVDVLAPGVDIESTWFLHYSPRDEERDTRVMNGSAQATAIVCGLAAYFRSLDMGLESPEALYDIIRGYALKDFVREVPPDTANLLVQNNYGEM